MGLLACARDHPLRTSPFTNTSKLRNAVWCEPKLQAEVTYAEIVNGMLRAPSWRGLVERTAATQAMQ